MSVVVYSHTTGQGYEAWPQCLLLHSGIVVCYFTDGPSHTGNNQQALLCRSTDAGVTWSSAIVVVSAGGKKSTAAAVGQLQNGRLIATYNQQDNDTVDPDISNTSYSDDDGATWTALGTIAIPSGYTWIYIYGRVAQVGPTTLYLTAYGLNASSGFTDSLLLQSLDSGVTWTLRSLMGAGASNAQFNETDIARTSTGWLALLRQEQATSASIWQATSATDGATWTVPTAVFFTGNDVSPSLFVASATLIYAAYAQRSNTLGIFLQSTTNEGSAWTMPTQVYSSASSDFGYPSLVNAGDVLGMAFYDPSHDIIFQSLSIALPITPTFRLSVRR